MKAGEAGIGPEAWKWRLSWLVTAGFLAAAAIIGIERYGLRFNRIRTNEEIWAQQDLKEKDALLAQMRATAKTPDEQLYVDFLARVKTNELRGEEMRRLRITDGVDRFEAWILATAYFSRTFGSCGFVLLPQSEGGRWKVRAAVGRNGNPADVFVDLETGVITCEGQETVFDPAALIASSMHQVQPL